MSKEKAEKAIGTICFSKLNQFNREATFQTGFHLHIRKKRCATPKMTFCCQTKSDKILVTGGKNISV